MKESCNPPSVKSSDLDFRASLLRGHFEYLVKDGYRTSEAQNVIHGIAKRELLSVFLERFTKENLFYYSYFVEGEKITSSGYEPLGDVAIRYQAAVDHRTKEGRSAEREKAELDGFLQIKGELLDSSKQRHFVWMSPPPPEEELTFYPGYGSYSFYFYGRFNPASGEIEMFAWRNGKKLSRQIEEANLLLGNEQFSNSTHPNDLLSRPIFADDFATLRRSIKDMPQDCEFDEAKRRDWAKYSQGIDQHAAMIATLIANGACEATLLDAQLAVEMDFTRWVVDGRVENSEFPTDLFSGQNQRLFSSQVRENFARFVVQYKQSFSANKTSRFACGSCGSSILSMSSEGGSFSWPGLGESLMTESMNWRPCPKCSESVRLGSEKCSACGLTKREYDASSTKTSG